MILVRKFCANCGEPSPMLLEDNGLEYFCPDKLECVRERREYRKRLQRSVCYGDPQRLFDRVEEASIASSMALQRATTRYGWNEQEDYRFAFAVGEEKVKKKCCVCGKESRQRMQDDGRPYFCRDTACDAARKRYTYEREAA